MNGTDRQGAISPGHSADENSSEKKETSSSHPPTEVNEKNLILLEEILQRKFKQMEQRSKNFESKMLQNFNKAQLKTQSKLEMVIKQVKKVRLNNQENTKEIKGIKQHLQKNTKEIKDIKYDLQKNTREIRDIKYHLLNKLQNTYETITKDIQIIKKQMRNTKYLQERIQNIDKRLEKIYFSLKSLIDQSYGRLRSQIITTASSTLQQVKWQISTLLTQSEYKRSQTLNNGVMIETMKQLLDQWKSNIKLGMQYQKEMIEDVQRKLISLQNEVTQITIGLIGQHSNSSSSGQHQLRSEDNVQTNEQPLENENDETEEKQQSTYQSPPNKIQTPRQDESL